MADEVFETLLRYPAVSGQKLPPDADFSRDNVMGAEGHPEIPGALPAQFGGHNRGYSPEDLMILSLSECHLLTYLRLAQKNRIAISSYEDRASGRLGKNAAGMTQLVEVVLRPRRRGGEGAPRPRAPSLLHGELRQLPRPARARDHRGVSAPGGRTAGGSAVS
jgi:organic hydroperoxide reductase OsmC/OhrA